MRRRPATVRYGAVVALLATTLMLVSSVWALTAPAFNGPDERQHYNSVSRLVAGGGWPLPYEVRVRPDTWQAVAESGRYEVVRIDGVLTPPAAAPQDRSRMHADSPYLPVAEDQMVQHPPGGYLPATAVVAAAGGGELRWDVAMLLMRLTSALLLAAAVPLVVGAVRRTTGSRTAGLVGGASLLTIPFLANVGGYVTNDTALILACSAVLYLVVRLLRSPRRFRTLLALTGVALGLALLVKGLALALVPVVGATAWVASRRRGLVWWASALAAGGTLALAFAVGGWWWLRNLVLLGTIQPSMLGDRVPLDGLDYDLGFFLGGFWTRYNRLFWGRGRPEVAFPNEVLDVAGILLVVLLVAALVLSRHRRTLAVLLVLPLAIIAITFQNAHSVYVDIGRPDRGVQGRYVFGGIAAYAATWGLLVDVVRRRRPDVERWAALGVVTLGAVVTVLGMTWVLPRLHLTHGVGSTLVAAAAGGPLSVTAVSVVTATAAASLVLTVGLALLGAARGGRVTGDAGGDVDG